MRKGQEYEISLLVKIAAPIVLAVVIILIVSSTKGKAGELNKPLTDTLSAGWPWGCKDIKDPVDFADFMKAMKTTYEECKNDNTKCGYGSCKKMTLKLGVPNSYTVIGNAELHNYQMDGFTTIAWDSMIYCEYGGSGAGHDFITAYYKNPDYFREICPPNTACSATSPAEIYTDNSKSTPICIAHSDAFSAPSALFAVPDNSKITIKPKYNGGLIYKNTELEITIDGGQFTNKQPAPLPPTCTGPSDCIPPKGSTAWGACEGGACNYDYCKIKSFTPACNWYTATCTLASDYTAGSCTTNPPEIVCGTSSTTPAYFSTTANGYKVKVYNLMDNGGTKVVRAAITGDGDTQIFPIDAGDEIWVHKSWTGKLWGTYDTDNTAKVSVGFKSIKDNGDGTYQVTVVQGCY